MYYSECLLILTLLKLNWKLILENIRKFKEILNSYYKVMSIWRKITHNTPNYHYKREKNENTNQCIWKSDDYFNFSSTCKCKISIHLLLNPAIIKYLKKIS